MNKLIILYGLPASGKSTFASQYCKEHPNTIHLNRDNIREMFQCKWSKELEQIVKHTEYTAMYNALESGFNVILDDVSNLNDKTQYVINGMLRSLREKLQCEIEVIHKYFNTPVFDCIGRDSLRENPVGERVILNLYFKYKSKLESNGC